MAECILNRLGRRRFRAFSAGSAPNGKINPFTLTLLRTLNYDVSGLRSKSWDEFALIGAPTFTFVFTVCGNAVGEACPVWSAGPLTAHWGLPDPAAVTGSEAERALAFDDTYRRLNDRISIFVNLPLQSLSREALQMQLDEIGRVDAEA